MNHAVNMNYFDVGEEISTDKNKQERFETGFVTAANLFKFLFLTNYVAKISFRYHQLNTQKNEDVKVLL